MRQDRGVLNVVVSVWLTAALGLGTLAFVAGRFGWFGGGDSADTGAGTGDSVETVTDDTGVPATDAIDASVGGRNRVAYLDCPDGGIAGFIDPGARVLAVARSADGAWVAVRSPGDASAVVWLPADVVEPDPDTGFAGLPVSGCAVVGYDPVVAGRFTGRVVDSASGAPLGGVTVAWDQAGDFVPDGPETALTAGDGMFTLDLPGEEYGLIINGTAIAYEVGYLGGADRLPTGWQVFPTWGESSTWLPAPLGDIALDAVGVQPTTTAPSSTVPTTSTLPETVPPTQPTVPPTMPPTVPNSPPIISGLTATPNLISAGPGASCGSTLLQATVADPTGVAAVKIAWSYSTFGNGTASGTLTMTRQSGTNTWRVTFEPEAYPPGSGSTFVQLVVTATDMQGLAANRAFPQTLSVEYCLE